MRTVPGVGLSGQESGTVVRCKCGAILRTLAPGEALSGRGRGASLREETLCCAECRARIRLRIAQESR